MACSRRDKPKSRKGEIKMAFINTFLFLYEKWNNILSRVERVGLKAAGLLIEVS